MKALRTLLQEIKPEIELNDAMNFIDTGILDSFDIIMLVSKLEATYQISISGLDIIPENFVDLQSIWNLVEKYRGTV